MTYANGLKPVLSTTYQQGVGKRGETPPLPRNCKRRETCRDINATGASLWEGSMGSMTRKPGDRPSCSSIPRGNYVLLLPTTSDSSAHSSLSPFFVFLPFISEDSARTTGGKARTEWCTIRWVLVVTNASVDLHPERRVIANTKTDDDGAFDFDIAASGRYSIRASAPSFQTTTSPIIYLSATSAS